jgi:hypothetical protein
MGEAVEPQQQLIENPAIKAKNPEAKTETNG